MLSRKLDQSLGLLTLAQYYPDSVTVGPKAIAMIIEVLQKVKPMLEESKSADSMS